MQFLRKFLLVLITPLLSLLLFALAFDIGVVRVVSQPSNVKQVLTDSGVYNTAVNSLLDQGKQAVSDSGSVDLTNPTVHSAANATFTPQYIKGQTETVIDSVYAWLDGKTAQPDFKIDLGSLKTTFATAAGQAAQQRAVGLPACADAASTSAAVADPVSATCLPKGVTPAAVGSQVTANLAAGKGFLDNPVITAGSVKGDSSNQSVFADQLKNAPKQYQRAKKTPIMLSVATLLVVLAIVFLSSSRRKGLRHVGIIVLAVGLFMLAFAYGLNYAVTKKAVPKIKLNNAVVQTDVRKIVTDVTQKVDQNYWIFGGIYAVIGALAIGGAMQRGGKAPKPKVKDDLEGEGKTAEDRIDLKEPDKISSVAEPAHPAKQPAKRTIKIQ